MVIALLLGAVLAAQPPAELVREGATGSPVSVHPLAPNEVLLEMAASGTEYTRADTATLRVSVFARGPTAAAAGAERDAKIQRIRNAARAAGVAPGDVEITEGTAYTNLDVFDVEEPPPPEEEPPAPDPAPGTAAATPPPPLVRVQLEPPRSRSTAGGTVTISLRDVNRLDSLKSALTAAGGELSGTPDLRLADDVAARRLARAKAYARGRADADAAAAAMNMRVVRIARVSERVGFDFMSMMMADMAGGPSRLRTMHEARGVTVPTIVYVGMDFVLAPR